jgi:hypothetical protein
MKTYQSHKRVQAAKITGVPFTDPAMLGGPGDVYDVTVEGGDTISMPAARFANYHPKVGDYVVKYDDGYTSFSPAKAFEDGYTLVET